MVQIIQVPQLPWHGPKNLDLPLPDRWDIEMCRMAGFNRPVLSDEQIGHSIAYPIGTKRIKELARNKKEVVILVDDMARVTRTFKIIPHILNELDEAGIPDSNIRFIGANGTHGPMNRLDFVSKLGADIVARFNTYNHNTYDHCTKIGTTKRGTSVVINTEVINCDLKISICTAFPHRLVGYSGSAKMILPGVAHYDSIVDNHGKFPPGPSLENPDQTEMYVDMEDAAQIAGLDFVVECVVNEWGESVAMYTGDVIDAHRACVIDAKTHYLTPTVTEKDIIIANAFCKVHEYSLGLQVAGCVRQGGDLVLVGNSPTGIVIHFLSGTFGKAIKGRAFRPQPHLNNLYVFSEYPDQHALTWIQDTPNRKLLSRWDDVLAALEETHPGKASVAIYSGADIALIDYVLK